VGWRTYYVVLQEDLAHILSEVLPESFAGAENEHLYQIKDADGNVIFGHLYQFERIPPKFVIEKSFDVLSGWTLKMAPRDTAAIIAKQSARRGYGGVLVILSAATIFVGLGILTFAVRTERHANKLKSDFIANVSHELKTPLSLIRMFGELLATGRAKGPETAKEYAEIITRESERLSRLIDNVLDFARIERGKAAYSFAVGDVAEVVARGLDVYRWRLEREGMKLVVEIPEEVPPVNMDANAMTLLLLNLVDNAIKYASEGKELRVSLGHEAIEGERGRLVLRVTDKGPGINVDEQPRIFDRFYRARGVRTRPVRGSGIGLSLVKHIAEAHGGGVSVESAPGKGATFTVWLPVADPAEPPPDSQERAAA
jgi:two-component system phosphate regulon sensor histidine kinase PhoR